MHTITLDAQTVTQLYMECRFKPEESRAERLQTLGITELGDFNFYRIEQHRQVIHELLSQLCDKFSSAEGSTFLNFGLDRYGDVWAGHYDANDPKEQLLKLGLAIQEAEMLDAHITWPSLPGGMPRIRIKQQ